MEEKNCKIYKIVDNTNGDIYIGSTTLTLKERLSKHKCSCNYVNKCTSYQIINNGNYLIELIEDIGVVTKQERYDKERYYIENNECINKFIPGRSKKEHREANIEKLKEYARKYREVNKEIINEKIRKHYLKNKERILKKKKEKFTCECGGKYLRSNKCVHEKTKKHIDYLNTIN